MSAIVTAIREIWGLFVEDASFTIALLVCIALAVFFFPRIVSAAEWRGPLLFALVALVLLENVHRSARH